MCFLYYHSSTDTSQSSEMPPSSSIYKPSPVDRYVASMVLSGVGDALGYKNGEWEFCHSGPVIHKELKELGGLSKIDISRKLHLLYSRQVHHCVHI